MEQNNIRRGQRNDREEGNYENGQFSGEALDIATKFQKLQDSVIQYKRKNEILETEKGELINKLYELNIKNDQLQTSYNELNTRFDSEKRRWKQRAEESDLEIQGLKKKLLELKDEASRYQSALGEATNVRFGDDDSNNPVQLSKAITEMQNLLIDFTTVKGKDVTINEKAASEILLAFKCTTKIVGGKGKPVLSAILQRITFDMLISYTNKYFIKPPQPKPKHTQPVPPNQQSYPQQQPQYNSRNSISPIDDTYLEAEIVSQMSTLCKLIGRLAQTRKGSDEISRVAPIKVRQQIYSVLGSRGFCKDNHQTIDKMAKYIFENALKYRQFNSDEKHREFCYKAVDVVKKFVHLYFRLQAQEPVPEYSYFFEAGVPLQNSVMDGSWDDENMDNLEVEICSFPLISIKSKDNSRKILSKAVVIAREKYT